MKASGGDALVREAEEVREDGVVDAQGALGDDEGGGVLHPEPEELLLVVGFRLDDVVVRLVEPRGHHGLDEALEAAGLEVGP